MKGIKEIAKAKKKENGNDRISNKDLLWYIIDKFDEYEKRISRLESTQKLIFIVLPIIVGVMAWFR